MNKVKRLLEGYTPGEILDKVNELVDVLNRFTLPPNAVAEANGGKKKWEVKTLGLKDELKFGKHKGESIEEVINTDSSYITWGLKENTFKLDYNANKIYEEAISGVENTDVDFGG